MTPFKVLYIFVEGSDDERFVASILKPKCTYKYSHVKIIRYACKAPSEISKLVSTIRKQQSSDYIFMCDMDARGDKSLCVTNRKSRESKKFSNIVDLGKILVVKEEIESWYLAGISSDKLKKYKIKRFEDTSDLTKENFIKIIPKCFDSVSDFMIEILKDYSIDEAIKCNGSLKYFFEKYP